MNLEWVSKRDFLNYDQVRALRADIAKAPRFPEPVGKGTYQKRVNTEIVHSSMLEQHLVEFFEIVYRANEEVFGFNIYDRFPNCVNINSYQGSKNEYPWHKDVAPLGQCIDVKLTAIVNISDPDQSYSGGDFELFTGSETRINELQNPGAIVVFPSFWYHRVLPVIEGERVSLSAWFRGPSWK